MRRLVAIRACFISERLWFPELVMSHIDAIAGIKGSLANGSLSRKSEKPWGTEPLLASGATGWGFPAGCWGMDDAMRNMGYQADQQEGANDFKNQNPQNGGYGDRASQCKTGRADRTVPGHVREWTCA